MVQKPPLPRTEVERILARLSPLAVSEEIVLIGGQAVAWWTYFLNLPQDQDEIEVFTSEDIDFEGAAKSASLAAELLGGEARFPDADHMTPSTGVVRFVDENGVEREIDFVAAPYGLDARDTRATAVPMKVPHAEGGEATVLVMHPERCMESRVHNVVGLRRTGLIALTQLRRSIDCARAWSRYLLGEETDPPIDSQMVEQVAARRERDRLRWRPDES